MKRFGYFEGVSKFNNVSCFLEDHVEKNPKKTILKWVDPADLKNWNGQADGDLPHKGIEVGRFMEGICRVAAGYKKMGIGKGDRVILFVPMSVPLYTAMFALQRIGAIPVFLDSWARRQHLGVSADVVQPKAMISFEKAFALVNDVPEFQSLMKICVGPSQNSYDGHIEELIRTSEIAPTEAVEKEDTALITFTTGSSGVPKGANRTHRFLAAQHYALDKEIPYESGDVDLPVFPIFSLNNIAAGVPTVIPAIDVGVPSEKDPALLIAQMRACNINCATFSPSILNNVSAFCLQNKIEMPFLRRVITGGAPISRDNLIDFKKVANRCETWVLFGSTEVEPMAHIEAEEMIGFKTKASEDPEWVDEGVNVGRFVDDMEYKFIKIQKGPVSVESKDSWSELEVPKGEVGELIVAGEHVCRDYYNNEEAFKKAKIVDERGVVWHRTGDLGRLDQDGYLWIVGRVHNAIHRGNRYEFPVRAELILKKLPFVSQAAYLGMPDEKLGEKTVCVVQSQDSTESTERQSNWISEIQRIMSKNGVPVDQVIFREKIPMDPRHHSKVEYAILRTQLREEGIS